MRQYRSAREVCDRLGISDETLRRWVKAGLFPKPMKIGRRVFFQEDSLSRFETQRLLAA